MGEEGNTADNKPREFRDQVKVLKAMDPEPQIDSRWMQALYAKEEKPDWSKFESFLSKFIMPSLSSSSKKSKDETLTLAIVTHSKFMNDGNLGLRCLHLWNDKPKNNQVIH